MTKPFDPAERLREMRERHERRVVPNSEPFKLPEERLVIFTANEQSSGEAPFMFASRDDLGKLIAYAEAVGELHNEEKRYYLDESGENSWDSVQDVIDYYGDDEVTPEQVKSFSVCSECGRLEINLAKLGDFDYAYESSHWPCPTAKLSELLK
jgi:hypothetical protein